MTSTLLRYQTDAYLKTTRARVLACTQTAEEGRFEVLLSETVLYPEGGGQPGDLGSVAGRSVEALRKEGEAVLHQLAAPLEHGAEVVVVLDWARRFDHMQQHTAQHLLTALAQDRQGWATTAFHLGPERCDIELDCAAISNAELAALEARANAAIRAGLPVRSQVVEAESLAVLDVRTRGLPPGFEGPVRLVEIEGLDRNTCGGTHVASTAELQAIKLLGTEPMRGGTRLFYLAGDRVLTRLTAALERERGLSDRLSCGPPDHLDGVDRLQAGLKQARRERKALGLELAEHLGRALAAADGAVASLHRPDDDVELLRRTAQAAREAGLNGWALLTAGQREGVFILLGPEDSALRRVGDAVAAALDGRGGGAKGQYQGKAARIDRRDRALALVAAS